MKNSIPQSVFDSKSAIRIAKQAINSAYDEIIKNHESGIFNDGDPNHPKYNNGINYTTGKPLTLFGHNTDKFMAKQMQQGKI